MDDVATSTDWSGLWRSGDLGRFCFISLGVVFYAVGESMITTILPLMVKDLGGVQYTGWSFAVYQTGSIIAGAAAGRLSSYFKIRTNMTAAALIFALGCLVALLSPNQVLIPVEHVLSDF